jgi:hypothetical protein
MNNKDILANAPEGATHVSKHDYWKDLDDNKRPMFWYEATNKVMRRWVSVDSLHVSLRSLADIKRIAELERVLAGTEACLGITGYIKKDSLAHTEIQDVLEGGAE